MRSTFEENTFFLHKEHMNTRKVRLLIFTIPLATFLAACGGAQPTNVTATPVSTQPPAATPTTAPTQPPAATSTIASAQGDVYQPVSLEVCQTIQESAVQALGVDFMLEADAPFADPLMGETGRGCILTATGTGVDFSNPIQVVTDLKNVMAGWEERPEYQADGPTGTASALARDMGLMFISAEWQPGPAVQCPADQPIGACNVPPDQQMYTIEIKVAQK